MTVVLHTNSVSAHQLPLARELAARVGPENFRYVYTGEALQGGGQEVAADAPWILREGDGSEGTAERVRARLEECDVLVSGFRETELFENRARRGLATFYQSERWFKPARFGLPGRARMLVPSYRRRARRLAAWLNADPHARYLAMGPWAKGDMLSLGVRGEKILDWGYFVAPSSVPSSVPSVATLPLKILWVGRMLDWKRVDTLVRAVVRANADAAPGRDGRPAFSLTLVGDGPEKARLEKIAGASPAIAFRASVPIGEVRALMRAHDLYVLASNAREGWGAALSEALSEGLTCLGTHEAGASAALLPSENLFHAGDWRALAKKLAEKSYVATRLPSAFAPAGAAERLLSIAAIFRSGTHA